jgi:hypothetical protein
MVKDETVATEAEYSAAVKECEAAYAADKDCCVNTVREHFRCVLSAAADFWADPDFGIADWG